MQVRVQRICLLTYNHVPEHFETIHYQDFNYVASKGPFYLSMKSAVPISRTIYDNNAISASMRLIDTGVRIDNPSGYAAMTTGPMTVDTIDPNIRMGIGTWL